MTNAMHHNHPNHFAAKPSTAMSFRTYGLLAERLEDGRTVSNLFIVGGLGGLPVQPEWGYPSTAGWLLALSMLQDLMGQRDGANPQDAPLVPHLTQAFLNLAPATRRLDDGTVVTPWQSRVAQTFAARHFYNEQDRDTLTLPLDLIIRSFASIVQDLYPDQMMQEDD